MQLVSKNRLLFVLAVVAVVIFASILTKSRIVGAAQEKDLRLIVAGPENQKCDYGSVSAHQKVLNTESQEEIYFVGCGGLF